MRVISGKYKGRKVNSPINDNVRPTSDKVKEAIFAIIQGDVNGAVVLDLFGGTGAMAIEALSRGAKKAIICDASPASLDLIKSNLTFVDKSEYDVFKGDYSDCIRRMASLKQKADVIILDPPYSKGILERAFELIAKYDVLSEGGAIIAERKYSDEPIKKYYAHIYTRRYGNTDVDYYRNVKKCAVTGSFDPFTEGHKFVVEKALEENDFVHVVMMVNEQKTARYSVETRLDMLKYALIDYKKRVKIEFYDGMAIDYCKENGIKYIYRGYRNAEDEKYEKEMAEYNESHGGVKTVLVKAENDFSSSEIKEKFDRGEDVSEYVDYEVLRIMKNAEKKGKK